MKINSRIRLQNPQFWIQIALAVGVPVGAYYGLTGADITTWGALWGVTINAFSNPYVLAMVGASIYNAIIDPTTRGINDSPRALRYKRPGGGV